MGPNEIYRHFKDLVVNESVKEWFPNGRNCIRVRTIAGAEYVFTYYSPVDWKIETVKSFLRTIQVMN